MAKFRPSRVQVRFNTLDSFRYREFRLLWTAKLCANGGLWVQQLVVGWLTFDLTQSPIITSLALGLGGLPFLLGSPIGGILADLWDRRKLLVAVWMYQAAATAGFAVLVLVGRVETWQIFAYVLAMGFGWAVYFPTWVAVVPNTVPRRSLMNAFALTGLAFNVAQFAVPAAAGLMVAVAGPGQTLAAGAAMFLGASLAAAAMRLGPPVRSQTRRVKPWQSFREAVKYVKGDRLILGLLLIGPITEFLLVPFVNDLMPVYASRVFEVGPAGLGLLMSAIGIGSTASSIVMASLGDLRHKGKAIAVSIALLVAATVAFSRMSTMAFAIPFLMLLSGALMAIFTLQSASIQMVVPEELRSRVSSLGAMVAGAFPLASLLAGGLAQLLSPPSATLVGSAILAVVSAGLLLKFREVWSFNQ
jgi:MFS family permease